MLDHGSHNGVNAVTLHQTVVDDGPRGIIMGKRAPSAHDAFLFADGDLWRGSRPIVGFGPSAAMPQSASL